MLVKFFGGSLDKTEIKRETDFLPPFHFTYKSNFSEIGNDKVGNVQLKSTVERYELKDDGYHYVEENKEKHIEVDTKILDFFKVK